MVGLGWWFGIPRVPLSNNLSNNPFHNGIPRIQTTNPNQQLTIGWIEKNEGTRNLPFIVLIPSFPSWVGKSKGTHFRFKPPSNKTFAMQIPQHRNIGRYRECNPIAPELPGTSNPFCLVPYFPCLRLRSKRNSAWKRPRRRLRQTKICRMRKILNTLGWENHGWTCLFYFIYIYIFIFFDDIYTILCLIHFCLILHHLAFTLSCLFAVPIFFLVLFLFLLLPLLLLVLFLLLLRLLLFLLLFWSCLIPLYFAFCYFIFILLYLICTCAWLYFHSYFTFRYFSLPFYFFYSWS